jgi:hypothetical protein
MSPMLFKAPESLRFEYDEIRAALLSGMRTTGEIGHAVRSVAELLQPHLEKEEAFALPPLAALAPLARGEVIGDATGILESCQRLRRELPMLLQEHQAIVTRLEQLVAASRLSRNDEWARFATKVMCQFRTEEELLYPAAILLGEHLHQRIEAALD